MFIGIIFIIINPSPAVCEGMADLFVYFSGSIGLIGILYSIIGINEQNTFKKWFGIIINLIFVIIAFHDLFLWK